MPRDRSQPRRPPPPLDAVRLEELALAYVARFAVSGGKLEAYLKRKLRERGWAGGGQPDPAGIVARFASAGYIDDAGWARAKSGSLLRRGYGPRRVSQTLAGAGIDAEVREVVREAEGEAAERRAAMTLAARRRFGPWSDLPPDRDVREKQIAAMIRAGHGFAAARAVVEAASVSAVETWAEEAE